MDKKGPAHKYMKVCDFVRRGIGKGKFKPGDKLPSCRELADSLGISYLTVTNAMRSLKDEGVISCVTRQGNFIAVAKKNDSVQGIKTGAMMNTRSHLYQDFFCAATEGLMASGIYWIPLEESGIDGNTDSAAFCRQLEKYAGMGIKNLVINGHRRFPYKDMKSFASEFDQIIYAIQYESEEASAIEGANIIIPDYRQAGRIIAQHLLKSGWEKIAFITYEPLTESERRICGTAHRTEDMLVMDGIEEVLKKSRKQGLVDVISENTAGTSSPALEKRILKLLDGKTAFAAMGDFRYKKIADAAEKAGLKLGKDFSFTGMYNTPWAEAWNFSSVSLREDKLAKLTVQALRENWKNRRIEIEPELIVRP